MREILFRGKDEDGDWLESMSLAPHITENGIITSYYIGTGYNTVAAETVGQYTGLTDKNGKKIFEGDIVSFKRVNALGYTTSRVGDVRYYNELPIFYIMATTGDAWDWVDCEDIEIIGNIHDNPELLKGDKDNA